MCKVNRSKVTALLKYIGRFFYKKKLLMDTHLEVLVVKCFLWGPKLKKISLFYH